MSGSFNLIDENVSALLLADPSKDCIYELFRGGATRMFTAIC